MFYKGIYRHALTTDIDLQIWNCFRNSTGFTVKATVVNRFNGIVYETKSFHIKHEDFKFWKQVRSA